VIESLKTVPGPVYTFDSQPTILAAKIFAAACPVGTKGAAPRNSESIGVHEGL